MDRSIFVSGDKYGLPYSKGLMASFIMATGLLPRKAYEVAKKVEDLLMEQGSSSITIAELRYLVHNLLLKEVGREYASRYLIWLALLRLKRPIILLLGGTTGVGKSTIATEVAHRLGITRIVSSDAIREVMRGIFSKELMPALYESSFLAYKNLPEPTFGSADPVIIGFREQTRAVAVGIKAVIDRAIKEASHLVLEGIHVVPGFININIDPEDAVVVPLVITAEDKEQHRSHFLIRDLETQGTRSQDKYREHFEDIRRIGEYIESLAQEYGYARISGLDIDRAVVSVLDEVMKRVAVSPGVQKIAHKLEKHSLEWQKQWEQKRAKI